MNIIPTSQNSTSKGDIEVILWPADYTAKISDLEASADSMRHKMMKKFDMPTCVDSDGTVHPEGDVKYCPHYVPESEYEGDILPGYCAVKEMYESLYNIECLRTRSKMLDFFWKHKAGTRSSEFLESIVYKYRYTKNLTLSRTLTDTI